jgi:hypothetical protein
VCIWKSYTANNSARNPYVSNKLCTQCRPRHIYFTYAQLNEFLLFKKKFHVSMKKKRLERGQRFSAEIILRERRREKNGSLSDFTLVRSLYDFTFIWYGQSAERKSPDNDKTSSNIPNFTFLSSQFIIEIKPCLPPPHSFSIL